MTNSDTVVERVTTGVPKLDAILEGGIPKNSIIFVAGLPGTGKTILCEQALFANARSHETVLYLSTLSEPVVKMLQFGQRFDFFNRDLVGRTVVYGDLGGALRTSGTDGFMACLEELVEEHRPSFMVIDSFKVLREEFDDEKAFRRFVWQVMATLATWEVTTLLVGEYSADDIREQPEFAIADGIIYLYGTEEAERQKRYLRIMKMRGTAPFAGAHSFNISDRGIDLHPRLNPAIVGEYVFSDERVGSLIAGMDDLLGGGVYESTATLITGSTGTGKTLVALSFLAAAAARGTRGMLITLEESREQVIRHCEPFGWNLRAFVEQGLIEIWHVSPSELDIDAHGAVMIEQAAVLGAKMVVIDSISAFEAAVPDPSTYQNYLWAITDYFKRSGVTILMTAELASLAGNDPVPKKVSFVADNILLLEIVQSGPERKHAISVVKMRGSDHDRFARELHISPTGISVGAPIDY